MDVTTTTQPVLAAAVRAWAAKVECQRRIRVLTQEIIDVGNSLRDQGVPGSVVKKYAGSPMRNGVPYNFRPDASLEVLAATRKALASERERLRPLIDRSAVAVYRAKEGGFTHPQIAKALGISKTMAQQLHLKGRDGCWAFQRTRHTTPSATAASTTRGALAHDEHRVVPGIQP